MTAGALPQLRPCRGAHRTGGAYEALLVVGRREEVLIRAVLSPALWPF